LGRSLIYILLLLLEGGGFGEVILSFFLRRRIWKALLFLRGKL